MTLLSAQPSLAATPVNYDQGHPWLIETDSHLCLSLNAQAGFGKDIQIVQEPCDGALRWEQWILHATTPGGPVYQIINNQSSFCLRAVTNQDFGVVDTNDCTGISNDHVDRCGPYCL